MLSYKVKNWNVAQSTTPKGNRNRSSYRGSWVCTPCPFFVSSSRSAFLFFFA